ncbi:MAG: 3-keto-5-aminohexanoate cleavage protein [Actinomycetota bacterium]
MNPLIITCAGVGAEVTRAEQPNLPLSAAEIASDAAECREAGASIYHLHVRSDDGAPTMDVATFRSAFEAIRKETDIIVQFTSGGAVTDSEDARSAPLELRPDMASLTTGTVNFADGVFWNPPDLVRRFYGRMRELGITPEFEIFEAGMLANAAALYEEFGEEHHRHYDFVLGVPGALPAWDDSVAFLASHLPEGATWGATGIGRWHLGVARAAITAGGHVRTGFEDVVYYERGRLAESNAQLIKRVAGMGREANREIATPEITRNLLRL